MRNPRWPLASLLASTLPAACAAPCIDDGLGQDDCPTQADGTDTEGATESNSNSNSNTDTMGSATMGSNTESMSGSQTGDTSETATETAGGTLWCIDADGDGFGDPDMCTQSDDMPPGTVDNGDDCDDENPNTFPGAAQEEDPRACMNDDDDDGWGDDDLPPCEPGDDPCVEPGTDCDDENPNAFPGAAENENPPDQCTVDEDGDGWGDANPGGGGGGGGGDDGPASGSDCYDTNPQLNPDTLRLTAFLPYQGGPGAPRNLQFVNPDASLENFVQLFDPNGDTPDVDIVSATFNENMEIYANDVSGVQLQSVDYANTCGEGSGTITPVGMMPYGPPGDIVCGLEFGDSGLLYGIGQLEDDLRTFDPRTGEVVNSIPITLDGELFDVVSCGMARDCTEGRLLLANGFDRGIYAIDEGNGEAQLLRDLSAFFPASWLPTGLEYDPVTRTALLSTGTELYRIDLTDESVDPELLGGFGTQVSNLQSLPICM